MPECSIDTVPPHEHIQVPELESNVRPWMVTVGAPGFHGLVVAGTQGIGVSTPSAAAVALATVGLEGERHRPNVGMLTMETMS